VGRDESPHTCSLSLVFLLALTYHGRPLPWNMHEGLPTMNSRNIKLDSQKLAEFCRRHRIRRLSLFGSVLRDDFQFDSDVDVLVEFQPGYTPGLQFFALDEELSPIFGGHKVDLATPASLYPRIRKRVLESAEVVYAEPE